MAVLFLQVYLAAGTVYGLEGQLTELEDAARCIHSGTDETELADLEDQVAAAAAQVHHAELQVRTLLPAQDRQGDPICHKSHSKVTESTSSHHFQCPSIVQEATKSPHFF
jgi:hypothetical protein